MKQKLILTLALVTLGIFVLSVPATYLWGPNCGAILRWLGVAVGAVYFILRTKYRKEQK